MSKQYTHKERSMHMSWCHKNDIIIYFRPIDWIRGNLVLIEKGKLFVKPETYKQEIGKNKLKKNDAKWWVEIMKLYTSKYLEYNKN